MTLPYCCLPKYADSIDNQEFPTHAVLPGLLLRVDNIVRREKLYLRTITIKELANIVNTKIYILRHHVLNGYGFSHYSEFINSYRIEAVLHHFHTQGHPLSLLNIALDHGFSSLTTFNRTFKHFTGLSPRHYLGNL